MGFMKSIDIVLSEYKLSDAQKNAVVNIMSGGTEPIKANTLKSLEKRGLVEMRLDGWSLSDSLADELRAAYSQPEPREEQFAEWEKELLGEESTESDEITHILDSDGVLKTSPEGEAVEAPVVPFFNRKALRDMRRNQARANRRKMREQGERRRKYGADDPKYFARKAYTLAA